MNERDRRAIVAKATAGVIVALAVQNAERRVKESGDINAVLRRALSGPAAAPRRSSAAAAPAGRPQTPRRVDVSATGAQRRSVAAERVRQFSARSPGGLSTDPAFLLGATIAAVEDAARSRQAAARVHANRISAGGQR